MIRKKKICKGKGKALGFSGCDNLEYIFKYGLCKKCYGEWLYNTEEGKALINNSIIKAKKESITRIKKETKEKKIELLSVDGYRKKYVQPIFNEIARLIDYGQPCIATGNFGKLSGGHYYSVGSNRTICLNLHNIHVQSFQSNSWKSGDNINYRIGIIKIYGKDYLDKIERLKLTPSIKFSKSELEEIKIQASKIRKDLKNNLIIRTPVERINLREEINNKIGIYK